MTGFLVGLLAACSLARAQSGVTIEVDQFGVGSTFRQGDITPVRLKLTSNLSQPTPVWVQWQVANSDGDIGEYGRSLTLTPNTPSFAWLYAPLPPDVNNSTVWTVRVFEERDGQRRGEIGGDRINATAAQPVVDIGSSMIAVVGQPRLGLDGYSAQSVSFSRTLRPLSGHEDTRIASGIKPAQMPDRWYGWLGFDALVWAGDASPQDLGIDQSEAIREYVRRGGHLIICLPAEVNTWGMGVMGQTELEDLLPCRAAGKTPRKDDAVPLADLLPVISKFSDVRSVTLRKPPEFSIRVFKDLRGDFNVIDNHYEPLISLPDGRVIAIQRQFGFGKVTVIGLDLADGRFGGLSLPQADAFWNRILGRRMDTPTGGEYKAIDEAKRLITNSNNQENSLGSGALVTGIINMEGKAGQGLLLALLLFAVYWLLAGPGGFALLKQFGYVKHAWLAFALCAAFFTAIAWGGVSLFPKRIQISHVTFLDHIVRTPEDPRTQEPQYQRAVSYFAAYLPEYGAVPISIESNADQRDALISWTPPGAGNQPFPNVDRYRVDVARGFANLSLPSRSTATQLKANWLGALDPKWGGTLRVDPNDPIRVELDAGGTEQSLRGKIINELPGTLTDVTMIWVKNNRTTRRRYAQENGTDKDWVGGISGGTLNSTGVWKRPAAPAWAQGDSWDISNLGSADTLNNYVQKRFTDEYTRSIYAAAASSSVNDKDRRNYFEMLGIFNQLNPPRYLKASESDNVESSVVFHRELGRELDLSDWFNRPCLIVTGILSDAPDPIPLRIAGSSNFQIANSVTVVRWVYPLPLNEKIAFREVFEKPE